ncbi:MAG: hypothetical protein QM676_02395 [Novosphingobium sp.]
MQQPDEPEVDRIIDKCVHFEALFAEARILELTRMFYHATAVLEGRDLPPQVGHDAISKVFIEASYNYAGISILLDDIEIVDTVAYGSITNSNTLKNGATEVHRGVLIWRKFGNDWFVVRDFFFAESDHLSLSDGLRHSLGAIVEGAVELKMAAKAIPGT